jgi:hypothetical protein
MLRSKEEYSRYTHHLDMLGSGKSESMLFVVLSCCCVAGTTYSRTPGCGQEVGWLVGWISRPSIPGREARFSTSLLPVSKNFDTTGRGRVWNLRYVRKISGDDGLSRFFIFIFLCTYQSIMSRCGGREEEGEEKSRRNGERESKSG